MCEIISQACPKTVKIFNYDIRNKSFETECLITCDLSEYYFKYLHGDLQISVFAENLIEIKSIIDYTWQRRTDISSKTFKITILHILF